MTLARTVIGIDISKDQLDLFDDGHNQTSRMTNDQSTIARWIETLSDRDVFIVMEATGGYDTILIRALEDAGLGFARVNPAKARDFARASGYLAKTDAIDARMLAEMGRRLSLTREAVTCPQRRALQGFSRRRDQLVDMRKQEKTRLRQTHGDDMTQDIQNHINWLTTRIEAIEARIETLIKDTPDLSHDCQLITSIPGIGPVTSTVLISLMPELGQINRRTVAALAGLAPINNDSGRKRGQRSIRGGRRRVRQALYMAAVAATRTDTRFAKFYRSLQANGVKPKVALIAVARKLLVTANAIIRKQTMFQA